jgi:multidrug efflux pump subunit AcrA (membrane-fusion protein)
MRKHKKQKKLPLGLILLSFIVFAGGFIFYKKFFSEKKKEEIAVVQNLPVPVSVIQIKTGEASTMQEWPARISPYKFAEIRPQVEGVIVARLFREGSYVKQGQPLYKIDPAEKIIIKAPISGYIGRSLFTDGALVTKNQTQALAVITQMEQMYADITIPSNMLEQLSKNKNATVNLTLTTENGTESYPYEGKIQFSEVTVDQSTDSVIVRALFQNPEEKLLSGEMVLAKINLPQENVITVPQRVTERTPSGELSVWVVNSNGTLRKQIITSDREIGSDWVVSSGLSEGELVVYEGFQKINPQSIVEPTLVSRFTGEKIEVVVQPEVVEEVQEMSFKDPELDNSKNASQTTGKQYIDPTTAAKVAQKMAEARGSKVAEEEVAERKATKVSKVKKSKVKSKAGKSPKKSARKQSKKKQPIKSKKKSQKKKSDKN